MSWVSVWDEMPADGEVVIIRVRDDYCVSARLITEFDELDFDDPEAESPGRTAWGEWNREEEVHELEDVQWWMRIPGVPTNA